MNPNICRRRGELDLEWRRQRFWRVRVGGETMHLRRSCTDERERYRVLPGIAAFQMRPAVLAVGDDRLMLVSRHTVVVLRMIVVVVDVGVQQGHGARRGGGVGRADLRDADPLTSGAAGQARA